MNTEQSLAPVGIAEQEPNNIDNFRRGVDDLLSRRSYFIAQVLPKFSENQDYFVVKGRKFLAKGGAEKLASIYNLTATFEKDSDTIMMLGSPKGLVSLICNLRNREGVVVGQGRGIDCLEKNHGDANKTVKMAQKRAFTDSVIRATGLSDIFSQDVETVYPDSSNSKYSEADQRDWVEAVVGRQQSEQQNEQSYSSVLTERQRKYLINLINSRISDNQEREQRLQEMESLSKEEASSWIQELCSC